MRIAQRERAILTLCGVLLGGALVWLRWKRPPPSLFGYDAQLTMVRVAVGFMLLAVIMLALARRKMLQNACNRRWTGLVLVGAATVLFHRVLLLRLLPGAPATALADLLLASIALGTTAIYATARLAWPALVFAAGAGGVALFPAHTPPIANFTLVFGSLAAAFALRAAEREADRRGGKRGS